MAKTKALIVCNMNRQRSKFVAKRLGLYAAETGLDVEVGSAGTNVHDVGDELGRTQLTMDMVRGYDIVFPTDSEVVNKIVSHYLISEERRAGILAEINDLPEDRRRLALGVLLPEELIGKQHYLRIPDVFWPEGEDSKYLDETDLAIRKRIKAMTPEEASILVETIYRSEERNMLNNYTSAKGTRMYPMELLDKALEIRLPWMAELIKRA